MAHVGRNLHRDSVMCQSSMPSDFVAFSLLRSHTGSVQTLGLTTVGVLRSSLKASMRTLDRRWIGMSPVEPKCSIRRRLDFPCTHFAVVAGADQNFFRL